MEFLLQLSSFLIFCGGIVFGSPVTRSNLSTCAGPWSIVGPTLIQNQGSVTNITCHREFIHGTSCHTVDVRWETVLNFTNCRGQCRYEVKAYNTDTCEEEHRITNGTKRLESCHGGIIRLNQRKSICSLGLRRIQQAGWVTFEGAINGSRNSTMNTSCWNICSNIDTTFYPLGVSVEGLRRGNYLKFFSGVGCLANSMVTDRSGNWKFYGNENLPDLTRMDAVVRAYKILRIQ